MYHPGKVIEMFPPKGKNIASSDSSTQVMLEMWDDNLITVAVDSPLVTKKDDIVLVDYTTPKLKVIKILKGDIAKNTWQKYREQHMKRKQEAMMIQKVQEHKAQEQKAKTEYYVG